MEMNNAKISGNIGVRPVTLSGNITPIGQKVVYDAKWGSITGQIERQEDLMIELHERDNNAMTVQEIEAILYL